MKLYICQTLDGFIASEDGNIDFLSQFDDLIVNSRNPKIVNTYADFLKPIKNVVEGYTTYKQIDLLGYGQQYKDYNHYVITKKHINSDDQNVTRFIDFNQLENLNLDPEETFLVGGSKVISEAFKRKLVTTMIITGLPVFLGDGIKLFDKIDVDVDLTITDITNDDKFYQVTYQVKYL